MTSAVKNRRPIETIRRIVKQPSKAKQIAQSADGYTPTATGAPSLSWTKSDSAGAPPGSEPNPTMSLVAGKPSGSAAEIGLKPAAKAGLRSIAAAFPKLQSFGGRGNRPISSSDHPRGLAVDFMIPNWKTAEGNTLGWKVAEYARANANALHVKYIIWDRKKWNPAGGSGWRPYQHPLGGGATLQHRDHVHVSFKG